ncbi:hypothetical protein BJL85_15725 [Vibrio parahaemolyticus]|uniref:hypothetical protein n=1 Tax=Vibrio parahaemolyticus TaxID=670 RepID=UPI0009961060|nr:hypothetical protein [Vibrio parahaemolyticus]OOX29510.1 hypothetical protein BJL85_15725 [Vibrio parahaemolyticus]
MKSIINTIAIASIAFSVSAFAKSPLDQLSVEAIKQTLTPEQIEQVLEQWRTEELKHIEQKARAISDRAPIEARREFVEQQINREYKQALITFGL